MSDRISLYGERYCEAFKAVRHCGDCNVYPCLVGGPAEAQRAGMSHVSPEHHRAASESAVLGWELRRRRAALGKGGM